MDEPSATRILLGETYGFRTFTFFENGEIVYTLAGCSRMRVGEGLHKNIKSKKRKNIEKIYSKKELEKEMEKV